MQEFDTANFSIDRQGLLAALNNCLNSHSAISKLTVLALIDLKKLRAGQSALWLRQWRQSACRTAKAIGNNP